MLSNRNNKLYTNQINKQVEGKMNSNNRIGTQEDHLMGLDLLRPDGGFKSVEREKTTARTSNLSVGYTYKLGEIQKNEYLKSLINTQTSSTNQPQSQKQLKYIFNSKFTTTNKSNLNQFNKKNLSIGEKDRQHQQFLNKSINSQCETMNYNCKSQAKLGDNLKSSRSKQFIDKHMANSSKGELCKNQFISSYQKFDINKLDFKSGFSKYTHQITSTTLSNESDHHYASLVSKSRTNIKKIIELNRMLKQNGNIQKVNQQKSSIERFTDDIQILEKLRTGCFGTVYKAKIISTGKFVAIKSFPYDRKFQQREQEICRMIHNPFIVKVYKIFYTNDMETVQQQKQITKPTQKLSQTSQQQRIKTQPTKKSLSRLSKQSLPAETFRFSSQLFEFQSQLQKQNLMTVDKRSNPLKQHIKEYHHVTNIVMDLYDCDLNDYIMMKNKTDNLTLKLFCYQMLRAVLYLHSNQICHRDIKPQNFLVKKHLVVLGDFGSAKIMKSNKNSNVAYICSRYYRAPELILGYKFYDKSIDMWSLGAVMAELALGKTLFTGANSIDQLAKIVRIIGQPDWRKISFMIDKIPKLPEIQPKGLKNLFSKEVSHLFIELLQSMLKFNPLQRITAGQALSHAFFDEIRDQFNFHQINKQMDIQHFLKFSRDQLKQNQHLKNKLIPFWVTQGQKSQCLIKTNNLLRF